MKAKPIDEQMFITRELLVIDLANEFNALIGSSETKQSTKPAVTFSRC